MELERVALTDQYFITRKLYPNVDFYSGVIYKAMGFPTEYFTVLFALPRFTGWISHWNEFIPDSDNKIVRPRQIYLGERQRNYYRMKERQKEDLAEYDHDDFVLPVEFDLHLPTILSRGSFSEYDSVDGYGGLLNDSNIRNQRKVGLKQASKFVMSVPKDTEKSSSDEYEEAKDKETEKIIYSGEKQESERIISLTWRD